MKAVSSGSSTAAQRSHFDRISSGTVLSFGIASTQQANARQDHHQGKREGDRHRLPTGDNSDQDSEDGYHVSVQARADRRRNAKQPDVRREGDHRAKDYEVYESEDRPHHHMLPPFARPFAAPNRADSQGNCSAG